MLRCELSPPNMHPLRPHAGAELSPPNTALLTQQGGTVVFDGTDTIFRHDDSGILKYTVRGLDAPAPCDPCDPCPMPDSVIVRACMQS